MLAPVAVVAVANDVDVVTRPRLAHGFSVSDADYPPFARRYGHEGTVGFTVATDAAGVPHDCVVTSSSTFAELDAKTCEIVEARMRFAPARNGRGQLIASAFSNHINWKLRDSEPMPFGDGTYVQKFTFNRDGSIASCVAETRGTMAQFQQSRCDADWATRFPYVLRTPLSDYAAVTVVSAIHTGDTIVPTPPNDDGLLKFSGTVGFAITAAGRVEQCVPDKPDPIARLIDVCARIFPEQTETRPAFAPGTAQHGSLTSSIYARPRLHAVEQPTASPRP